MRMSFFAHKVLPFSSKYGKLPLAKRRLLSRVRFGCATTYVLFFFAFLLFGHRQSVFHDLHADRFSVSDGEAPVLNETGEIRYANTPVSSLRPQNQFVSPTSLSSVTGRSAVEQPVMTVITVTRNPREVLRETAKFVREQSLLSLRWLIVNDHSESAESYEMLKHIASQDKRFQLVNNTRDPGFSNGRIYALSKLTSHPTKYFAFLDDDDYFEYTAYEKCAWMLESNTNASMCGTYVVGFGEKNYTWDLGFHSGYRVVLDNPLTGSEIIRTSLLRETGCTFDESLQSGMEDWDFYLCLADKGKWGATIPEHLFWYRQNPLSLRKTRWGSLFDGQKRTSDEIRSRYRNVKDNFPKVVIERTREFETMNMTAPFGNKLSLGKSILFVIPWMAIGGGDTANLRLVEEFSKLGYRVTIVCTLLNLHANSMISRPLFMQYTHDVFTVPAMIRLADAPRFFSYLVDSRNVETVLISNSQLGYGILPWLSARHPDVTFVDYVHNEEPTWKNGGYAAFSTVHQTSLDATFTSSEGTRRFMIDNGHDPSSVETKYLGIDLSSLHPLPPKQREANRRALSIPPDAVVVIYLARMIAHKQPRVATEAFLRVVKDMEERAQRNLSSKFKLIMIGDGPMMHEVERISAPRKDLVMNLGGLHHSDALKYLEVSDVFCLPSTSEGVSFALAESMALGVTPLTSTVGGFSELLKESGSYGVMVEATGTVDEDVDSFARSMKKLMVQETWRKEMGRRAANRVRSFFDARERIPQLVQRILTTRRSRPRAEGGHRELSALHYTQLAVLKDLAVFSDFPEIHKVMQGKVRGEYGSKYRATCGEYSEVISKLIDFLEDPKPCVVGEDLNVERLRAAAIEQCGRWCIMNPEDRKFHSGWYVKEGCGGFENFNDPQHKCSLWYENLAKELK